MSAEGAAAAVEAPDYAEAFRAWRVWRVVGRRGELRLGSMIKPTVWPPGEALCARCLRTLLVPRLLRRNLAHEAPAERCECGVYGADLRQASRYLEERPAHGTLALVLGEVSLWGTVVECERGFRASHAYPLRLYVPLDDDTGGRRGWSELAAGLAGYGVPVEVLPGRYDDAARLLGEAAPDRRSRRGA